MVTDYTSFFIGFFFCIICYAMFVCITSLVEIGLYFRNKCKEKK